MIKAAVIGALIEGGVVLAPLLVIAILGKVKPDWVYDKDDHDI